jgi:hypothetical protein
MACLVSCCYFRFGHEPKVDWRGSEARFTTAANRLSRKSSRRFALLRGRLGFIRTLGFACGRWRTAPAETEAVRIEEAI